MGCHVGVWRLGERGISLELDTKESTTYVLIRVLYLCMSNGRLVRYLVSRLYLSCFQSISVVIISALSLPGRLRFAPALLCRAIEARLQYSMT